MVGIPILGYLAHYFYIRSPSEIQQHFGWIAYVFLFCPSFTLDSFLFFLVFQLLNKPFKYIHILSKMYTHLVVLAIVNYVEATN